MVTASVVRAKKAGRCDSADDAGEDRFAIGSIRLTFAWPADVHANRPKLATRIGEADHEKGRSALISATKW
jgi:hypothetical protein